MKKNSNVFWSVFFKKVSLVFFGIILSFVLLEIILRVLGFVSVALQEYRNNTSLKKKDVYRILCLGESTTVMGGEYSYPAQLEDILNAYGVGKKFSVINRGVVGTNTSIILEELIPNLEKYHPDIVVTMMGINDKGIYEPFADNRNTGKWRLFNSLKVSKLVWLIWFNIVKQAEELGFYGWGDAQMRAQVWEDRLAEIRAKKYRKTFKKLLSREEKIKEVITGNPCDDNAYFELACLYFNQGKVEQAEALCQQIIKINPKNEKAYIQLGWYYCDSKRNVEARDLFAKALELNKFNDVAYLGLGRIYLQENNEVACEAALKKSIELNPVNADSYFLLGSCYLKYDKLAQAESLFKKAVICNLDKGAFYGALALVYYKMGAFEYAHEYQLKANETKAKYHFIKTQLNYREMKNILSKRNIKLVCVQYPMLSVEPLKKMVGEGVVFVDNERIFQEAVRKESYSAYFVDIFGGSFGHCTPKGNRLLAQNVAHVILPQILKMDE